MGWVEKSICVKQALLWLSMHERLNCPITFDGIVLYRIIYKKKTCPMIYTDMTSTYGILFYSVKKA